MLTSADDIFHQPRFQDFSWGETNWFSFIIPEENRYGTIQAFFRPNLGVVQCHIAIWSRHCRTPLDTDYWDAQAHMPMPRANLDNYTLPNGLHVNVMKPLSRYRVDYDGGRDVTFHLEFEALMAAVEADEIRLPKGKHFAESHAVDPGTVLSIGHIDQSVMVTGELIINGQVHKINFPASRDHSWSPRKESDHAWGNFDEGYFGPGFGFHVQTENITKTESEVVAGYILKDGQIIKLEKGAGYYQMDGWITTKLEYHLTDVQGRSYRFVGEPTATFEMPTHFNQYIVYGLVRWQHEDLIGWGDFHTHWTVAATQKYEREHDVRR